MEIISEIITNTLNSFDFSFCITVNVATYLAIKFIDTINGNKDVSTWQKRLVLIMVLLLMSCIWYVDDSDLKHILNSAILAPVFWSWIMKPLCKVLKVDYKDISDIE